MNDLLEKLTKQDTISLLLFALFKLKEDPKYSSLSELSYVLDMENFLRLCKYFGGSTITIPTMEEVKIALKALIVYNYMHKENLPYSWVKKHVVIESEEESQKIRKMCYTLRDLMKDVNLFRNEAK